MLYKISYKSSFKNFNCMYGSDEFTDLLWEIKREIDELGSIEVYYQLMIMIYFYKL